MAFGKEQVPDGEHNLYGPVIRKEGEKPLGGAHMRLKAILIQMVTEVRHFKFYDTVEYLRVNKAA